MGKLHSRLPLAAASGTLVLFLALLAALRRAPHVVDDGWQAGNVLDTQAASGIDLERIRHGIAALELVLLAALITWIASAVKHRRELAARLAISLAFATIFADSVTRYATRVGGRLYVGLCDDAFISMRYARNLSSGLGLTYNAGESVEGYSNPLWTLLMAVPHALHVDEGLVPVVILVAGGLLLLATALLVDRELTRRGVAPALRILCVAAVLFDASTFEFAVAGLETPLTMFAATLAVTAALASRERLVMLGLALLPLSRADGTILATLIVAWHVLDERATSREPLLVVVRRRLPRLGVLALAIMAALAWHALLYGELAPNTYYLKVYAFSDRIVTGVSSYGVRGLVYYGLPCALTAAIGVAHPRARGALRMLVPACGMWLYGIYVGGDAFLHLRFVGPAVPLVWLASGIAVDVVWQRCAPATRAAMFVALGFIVPVMSERGVLGATWDRSGWIHDNVVTAKTLERNLPPGSSVAIFYAGMVPYLAPQQRFVDLLGKTEARVARTSLLHGRAPGHNKFDFAYVYGERRPDVTFTALSCPEVDAFLARPLEDRLAIARKLPESSYQAPVYQLLDPAFLEHYRSGRVVLRDGDAPAGHTLGCWWVRDDASLPVEWQIAPRP